MVASVFCRIVGTLIVVVVGVAGFAAYQTGAYNVRYDNMYLIALAGGCILLASPGIAFFWMAAMHDELTAFRRSVSDQNEKVNRFLAEVRPAASASKGLM